MHISLSAIPGASMVALPLLSAGPASALGLLSKPVLPLETAINGNRSAAITARGFVLKQGGVPIVVNGNVVGVVGVSADTLDHDEQIAKAAVGALSQ